MITGLFLPTRTKAISLNPHRRTVATMRLATEIRCGVGPVTAIMAFRSGTFMVYEGATFESKENGKLVWLTPVKWSSRLYYEKLPDELRGLPWVRVQEQQLSQHPPVQSSYGTKEEARIRFSPVYLDDVNLRLEDMILHSAPHGQPPVC